MRKIIEESEFNLWDYITDLQNKREICWNKKYMIVRDGKYWTVQPVSTWGSSRLDELEDIDLNSLKDWQVLKYNSLKEERENWYDEGGALDVDVTSNYTVGGIAAGTTIPAGTTFADIFNMLLNKYQEPIVSLSLNPSTTLMTIWEKIDSITTTVSVSKKSNPITRVDILENGTVVKSFTDGVSAWGSFTYKKTDPTVNTTTFKVNVYDGKSWASDSKTITFVNPSYIGTVTDDVVNPTATDIKKMEKVALTSKKFTKEHIDMEYGRIVFAYPMSYGSLTSIKDGNNVEYINSYTKTTVTIDGISYNVYTLTDSAGVEDFAQIYS